VIPFGAIGAIWGHHEWGVPLSMFSVIGLIGMTGIIINDAIVLVSTVDEYARRRALRPALLAAVGDRLRPVFLTTATTVLGLAPLLFERSQQAQFLKPTVITLVYGLGFGMVLVLLVVPAVLGIGEDLARIRRSTRRLFGLAARRGGWRLWLPLALTIAGLLGAMAATIGRHAMVGEAWAPLAGVVPPGLGGAVAAQIAGSVLVVAAGAFLAFVLMPGAALRRSAAGRAAQKLDDVVAEEGQPHH
ncbi:MAG: efflux RND transporter permease subunit, partial [Alphaproteobacteria bacterium]